MQRLLQTLVLSFALLTLTVGTATAHGDQEAGEYVVVFGWRNEPAYAGLLNGPEIYLSLRDDADLEARLAALEARLAALENAE